MAKGSTNATGFLGFARNDCIGTIMKSATRDLFEKNVIGSYGRFEIELVRGEGSYVWDAGGKRYLDLGGGIAVCALGHAHPEIADALNEQARKLVHVSNLYYNELQGRLAERLVKLIAPGRIFFCNSGAEANEGLYKLARRFGHDTGRYEVITTFDSFHGRTLAGIAATGQEKVKKGFEPAVAGFKHVPFNDLAAMRAAITPQTAAVLIEAVQGESGVTIAAPEYLRGLRALCDEHHLLLMLDEVQCGHFRTGAFHAWQRILEDDAAGDFLPDAISMAKSLGNGFPIGAFWVREKHASLLVPGSHATTFGGTPLACAVALRVLDVIQRENLAQRARETGQFVLTRLQILAAEFPAVVREVRGLGMMIGVEFEPASLKFANSDKSPAIQVTNCLHEAGVLTVPAGTAVVRLLPPLNLSHEEAEVGIRAIERVVRELAT